jgi:Meckel syndrome type 1 protein
MTASAINPVTTALPGLAGGGNGQATGPLAGFEALLAALFGDADIAGVVDGAAPGGPTPVASGAPTIRASDAVVAPLFVGFEDATGLPPAQTEDATLAGEDAAATLAVPDALLAIVAAPTASAPPVTETTAAAPEAGKSAAASTVAPGGADALAAADAENQAKAQADPSWTEQAPAKPTATATPAAAQVAPQVAPQAPSPTAQQAAPHNAQPAAQHAPPPAALTGQPAEAAAKAPEPDPITLPLPPEALAQASARDEVTRAADAPPAMPLSKKDKDKKGAVTERSAEATETSAEAAPSKGAPAAATGSATAGKGDVAVAKAPKVETPEPEARKVELPDAVEQLQAAESRGESHSTQGPGAAPHAVRGAPETVANLAAQIMKKLDGRSTRFDVELDPLGLGKVDVRVEIGANGRMTASLSFENPQAAAELKSRSGELHKALEQAGFDLSGGMSFDVAGDHGHARQDWGDGQQSGFRGRAFQQALETANDADLAVASGELRLRRGVTAGVDVRI